MSFHQDLEDTARLRRESGMESAAERTLPDDTDRIRFAGGATPESTAGASQAHAYARGIIRFYRARSILENSRDAMSCRRAWRYLDRLQPCDLPECARAAFFELTYHVHSQPGQQAFASDQFTERVFDVTGQIDHFVDDMNREIDA